MKTGSIQADNVTFLLLWSTSEGSTMWVVFCVTLEWTSPSYVRGVKAIKLYYHLKSFYIINIYIWIFYSHKVIFWTEHLVYTKDMQSQSAWVSSACLKPFPSQNALPLLSGSWVDFLLRLWSWRMRSLTMTQRGPAVWREAEQCGRGLAWGMRHLRLNYALKEQGLHIKYHSKWTNFIFG